MCGLIGWVSKNNQAADFRASTRVAEQYEEQHHRGVKGFGLIEIDNKGKITVSRSTEPVKMMVELLNSKARHIILHHRSPTSTENKLSQTHPMVISNPELKFEWLINHNGVIRNSEELKKKHEALGYKYVTEHEGTYNKKFNDSEAFAIELARYLENKSDIIGSRGPAAFIAVKTLNQRVQAVIIGTNGNNPMAPSDMGDGYLFASENAFGEKMKDNTAITYKACYDKKNNLTGFKAIDDLPEIKFVDQSYTYQSSPPAPAPAPAPARALPRPSAHFDDDDIQFGGIYRGAIHGGKRPMGFGAHQHGAPTHIPDVPPRDVPAPVNADAKENTYAGILNVLRGTSLGKVWKDPDSKDHEFIINFDYMKFGKLFSSGDIEGAEDMWDEYVEKAAEEFSFENIVIDQVEAPIDFSTVETADEALKLARESTGKKMAAIAYQVTPMFKAQAFIETALAMGYRLKTMKEGEATLPPREGKVIHNPTDEEIQKSAEEVFSSTTSQTRIENMAQETAWRKEHPTAVFDAQARQHYVIWGHKHSSVDCQSPRFHQSTTTPPETKCQGFAEGCNCTNCIEQLLSEHAYETGNRVYLVDESSIIERPEGVPANVKKIRYIDANNPSLGYLIYDEDLKSWRGKAQEDDSFRENETEDERNIRLAKGEFSDYKEYEEAVQKGLWSAGPEEEDERAPHQTPVEKNDEEAALLLKILSDSASAMQPHEVIAEADSVADAIRQAASTGINEQLMKVQAIAAEEGIALKIPFYETRITEIAKTATRRFSDLAKIVSAAKTQQDDLETSLSL